MMTATLDFLKKLRKNNRREWFAEHRAEYDAALADFTQTCERLLGVLVKIDPRLKGTPVRDCLFRIYRDTRFASEKSPYKTNFGAYFVPGGRKVARAGYYLHLEPGGQSMIAGGIYMPPGDVLQTLRAAIATEPGSLRKALQPLGERFGGLMGEQLKTAPRGFAKDHPAVDLLRFKSLITWRNLTDEEVLAADLPQRLLVDCRMLKPLCDYVNNTLDESGAGKKRKK